MKLWPYVGVLIGLVIANVVYQYATERNWADAFNATYFQAIAVLACLINREFLQ